MARKKDKKAKRKAAAPSQPELSPEALEGEIARLKAGGDYSSMLEAAKALYKRRPDEASGTRVADAYGGRIRQLQEKGLYREAAALLPLRDRYRPGELSAEERYTRFYLLLQASQVEAAAQVLRRWPGAAEEVDPLRADLLVLYPEAAGFPGADPEGRLARGLGTVQAAFAAYDREDDSAALDTLKALGLKSPFRSWRLFLRGAIAFYRRDDEAAAQALGAVPAGTAAATLAAAFLRAQATGSPDPLAGAPTRKEPTSLEARRDALANPADPRDFGRRLEAARALVSAMPGEPRIQRLTALFLWHCLLHHRGKDASSHWPTLKKFFHQTLVDDPRFSRTRALMVEHFSEWEEAEEGWVDFADAIKNGQVRLPAGIAPEHARARVHLRAAAVLAKALDKPGKNPFFHDEPSREEVEHHLEEAIQLDPARPDPFVMGLNLARDRWDDLKRAAYGADRLVGRFPQHLEGQLAAAGLALKRQVFQKALGFLRGAEAVEPLHPEVRRLKGQALLQSARKRASEKKYDLARKDYGAALPLQEGKRVPAVRLELGCLELASGRRAEGEALIAEAIAGLGRGAGAWFRAMTEGHHLGVDPKLLAQWSANLTEGLARPDRGVALELAAVYREYENHPLAAKALNRRLLTGYLKKCARLGFSSDEALTLCQLLYDLRALPPLAALARQSRMAHPGDFHFPAFELLAVPRPRPGDFEKLQDFYQRALGSGDERFAKLLGRVLALETPRSNKGGWGDDVPFSPDDVPQELLDAVERLLGGGKRQPGARPPSVPKRRKPRRGQQLDLFGEDE